MYNSLVGGKKGEKGPRYSWGRWREGLSVREWKESKRGAEKSWVFGGGAERGLEGRERSLVGKEVLNYNKERLKLKFSVDQKNPKKTKKTQKIPKKPKKTQKKPKKPNTNKKIAKLG